MSKDLKFHNGRELHPLRIDPNTWVLVPKERATKEYAVKYREKMAESRKLAIHDGYYPPRINENL